MRKSKTSSKKKTTAASRRRGSAPERRRRPAARRASRPIDAAVAVAPSAEPAPPVHEVEAPAVVSEPITVSTPEVAFASRVPPAELPRPLPAVRRGIFFDVENSSRPEHVAAMLDHLDIDWTTRATDLVAIGNWRVVSHETARLLARRGAQLVHSAPSVGIRDWSDLRIAVAAGAWLAAARPGDSVQIISDDQAFDAVGDVAATLGVLFHRLSFRGLAGLGDVVPTPERAVSQRHHGARRGRRRRGPSAQPRQQAAPAAAPALARAQPRVPAPPTGPPPAEEGAHTAPADEIKHVVEELLGTSSGGVTLDALGNALKARGFRRTPGSPRLITRLRRLKGLEVTPRGIVKLVEGAAGDGQAVSADQPAQVPELEPWVEAPPGVAAEAASEAEGGPEPTAAPEAKPQAGGAWRRRRRRGGRRWRDRGGAGKSDAARAVATPGSQAS